MTNSISVYIRKADAALSTARLALNAGDADSACNRAYYAMFDMAHAALLASGAEMLDKPIKTHNGLIGLFGLHLVRSGNIAAEHGHAFNRVQNFRLVADYEGDFVRIEDATWAVERAEAFAVAIKAKFFVD